MRLTKLFSEFFSSERAGGFILIACTVVSLLLANSGLTGYTTLWHTQVLGHELLKWINDGLMTIFFLLIGLELERELYVGELSAVKNAMLPVMAAIGGMIVPALFYVLLNHNTSAAGGAGIPMSTDIAFALGILSLLGKRVPPSLKVFLLALAIIDDLGAILVIALFYSSSIHWNYLGIATGIFALMILLNRLKVNYIPIYLLLGCAMWYFMHGSGIHPTITGVLLALVIPFGDGGRNTPSYKLQHLLNKPVGLIILPLFALANTCIVLNPDWHQGLASNSSLGIFAGLIAGKPIGIVLFAFIAVLGGIAAMPEGLTWKHIAGAGLLGGIGFTMSIFITMLAFAQPTLTDEAKIAILIASAASAILGLAWLAIAVKKT